MKIYETVPLTRQVEIGRLQHAMYLPTSGRLKVGMKTTCQGCRQAITDEYFIGGFSPGRKNVLLHVKCADPDDVKEAMGRSCIGDARG